MAAFGHIAFVVGPGVAYPEEPCPEVPYLGVASSHTVVAEASSLEVLRTAASVVVASGAAASKVAASGAAVPWIVASGAAASLVATVPS